MAGVITFNDLETIIKGTAYWKASTGVYTVKPILNVDLFPDTGVLVNDSFIFAVDYLDSGKANALSINLDVGIAATSITGVWEYCSGGTNAVPNWYPLTGVTDGTNGLTTTGLQNVTFDVPDDWDNFHLTSVSSSLYYRFLLRYRITSLTGLTEGGHIGNYSIKSKGVTIHCYTFDELAPVTMNDIYNADVAGGWGVVSKNKNQYSLRCNLEIRTACFFQSTSEQIQFEENWFLFGSSGNTFLVGEILVADKTRFGSNFTFLGKNVNYPSVAIGVNSKIYNSSFRCVDLGSTAGFNGYWGMSLGQYDGQAILDTYFEGLRNLTFNNQSNVVIGVKGHYNGRSDCHVESPGAIIRKVDIAGGNYCFRPLGATINYIHECDLSGAPYPINPYQVTSYPVWAFYLVDCNFGDIIETRRFNWTQAATALPDGDHVGYEVYSFLLRTLDINKRAIKGAKVELKDKNGKLVFSYNTNDDGYCGVEEGTATGVSSTYLQDTSKSWSANELRFKEFIITSGTGINQRRIVRYGNTATQIDAAWEFSPIPAIGDKYIVIPYVSIKEYRPESYVAGSRLSIVTDLNPFTLTVRKSGYKEYTSTFDLTKKFDEIITLKKQFVNEFDVLMG